MCNAMYTSFVIPMYFESIMQTITTRFWVNHHCVHNRFNLNDNTFYIWVYGSRFFSTIMYYSHSFPVSFALSLPCAAYFSIINRIVQSDFLSIADKSGERKANIHFSAEWIRSIQCWFERRKKTSTTITWEMKSGKRRQNEKWGNITKKL